MDITKINMKNCGKISFNFFFFRNWLFFLFFEIILFHRFQFSIRYQVREMLAFNFLMESGIVIYHYFYSLILFLKSDEQLLS